MCIDADMELVEGFLEKALAFMDTHPHTAAVTGIIKHIVLSSPDFECLNINGGELFPLDISGLDASTPALLKSIPGAGLFRSKAVLQAGNFHPFLRAEEEYELCQRLRQKGNELWYLPYRIALHHGYSGKGLDEIKRRWQRGFMKGIGEMFRLSASTGFFIENIRRFQQHLIVGSYILMAPLFLILGLVDALFPIVWLIGFILMVVVFCSRKNDVRDGIYAMINKAIIGICIYAMFFSKIKAATTYPVDPIIVDLSVR